MRTLICLILWPIIVQAGSLSDPRGELAKLPGLFPQRSLGQAFVCPEKLTYLVSALTIEPQCGPVICMTGAQKPRTSAERLLTFEVENCTADNVDIFASNGFDVSLSSGSFQQSGATLLRSLLANMDYWVRPNGDYEVHSIGSSVHQWIERGQKRPLSTVTVCVDLFLGIKALTFEIVMVPQFSGLRQLALVRELGDRDVELLRLPGLVDDIMSPGRCP